MRKSLQLALMASPVIATFLSATPPVRAQTIAPESITASTDDSGHKVYVNDSVQMPTVKRTRASTPRESSLVYWSVTDHCWKPVPAANVRAARSAADEVKVMLANRSEGSTSLSQFQDSGER